MDQLSEGLRKLILAGIGAVAATKEKSEGILDELVKKGELTVEQGKVLNEELKHNIKDAIRENVTLVAAPLAGNLSWFSILFFALSAALLGWTFVRKEKKK